MRVVLGLMLVALVAHLGCATSPPTVCAVCSNTGLVPPTVPEVENNPNGHTIWPSSVTSPIPADLHRLDDPLPEDLAQSEDAVYARADWIYVFRVRNRGSRSAILVGRLYHHENAIIGRVGQVLETPWGRFQRLPFFGYEQGWFPGDQLVCTADAVDPRCTTMKTCQLTNRCS